MEGFNKALQSEFNLWESFGVLDNQVRSRPCVFLSHKHEDKQACMEIANYFKKAGVDYYLDIEDKMLQQSVLSGDPHKITESIKRGIKRSSHMLCVVSTKTYKSDWVPFEVGYGHAAIIDKAMVKNSREKQIKLSVLLLKGLSESSLPDFMKVGYIIPGTKSLNSYMANLLDRLEGRIINEDLIKSHQSSNHPLDNVLNWEL